jgi:hypothetical protein
MAAKRFAPQVPLWVLLPASFFLDVLAISFGYLGIESGDKGDPWSHGLFMSVCWSAAAAFLFLRVFRSLRAGVVVGLVFFSHWILDFISHPIPFSSFSFSTWRWDYGHPLASDLHVLFRGSPVVGLGLYNHISAVQATMLEVAMFLIGTVVYLDYQVRVRKKRKPASAGIARSKP